MDPAKCCCGDFRLSAYSDVNAALVQFYGAWGERALNAAELNLVAQLAGLRRRSSPFGAREIRLCPSFRLALDSSLVNSIN